MATEADKIKNDPTYRLTKEGKVYRRGKKKYVNLDMYDGEFLDGMRHGNGTMCKYSGDVYTGEFESNNFHGHGSLIFTPYEDGETQEFIAGKRYEGDFKYGKFDGQGIFVLGNGDAYSGSFEKGLYHGHGILTLGNGDSFNGNWERGYPSGTIKRIVAETGDEYEGTMRQGKRHGGAGKQVFGNGRGYYDGGWERDKPQGMGTRVYSNGSRYVGKFADGEVHGDGVMFYANGDQYVGKFHRGHLSGRGVLKYARGESYDGNFFNGFMYGDGKYTYSDGGYYDGEFKAIKINKATQLETPLCNGLRDGFGLRVFTNGSRYTGQWSDDKMHGQGQLIQADGAGYEGVFFNGYRQGKGKEQYGNVLGISYLCPMGIRHPGTGYCTYIGMWKRDYWHQKGEFSCCDGRNYTGEFKWGKKHGMGTQEYLREGDKGEVTPWQRMCIKGRDSMYRYERYEGNWQENVKMGHGRIFFLNGDSLAGMFEHGQPHGLMEVRFNRRARIRYANYVRGTRVDWVENHVAVGKATKVLSMFHEENMLLSETEKKAKETEAMMNGID